MSVSITGPNQPVGIGTQYQFKALLTNVTGAATWTVTAGAGTINAARGLYTAPTAVPESLAVTVTVSTKVVSANYNFVLCQPPASIISWSPLAIPFGAFTLIVSGQNFNSQTTVAIGAVPVKTGYASAGRLVVSGTIPAGPVTQVQISVTNPGAGGNTFSSPTTVSIGSRSGGDRRRDARSHGEPAAVTLAKGKLQPFTAKMTKLSGTVTWSASGGTMSPSGVFTVPAGPGIITGKAVSSANPAVFGTATVTIAGSGTGPAITSLVPAALPFGPFNLTVNGSNFNSGSTVSIDGTAFPTRLSQSLNAFYNAILEMGVDQSVTSFTNSEFGRTLQPSSGGGRDHAWGSHAMIVGGAVKGAALYGAYPQLALGGPDDANTRGTLIPTTRVEQYGATLAKWFGVPATSIPQVFPTVSNFATADLGFVG